MTRPEISSAPSTAEFIAIAGALAERFGWPMRTSAHGAECVCVARVEGDQEFERIVWVYDVERVTLRCMLVGASQVPAPLVPAVLELCARVNQGLTFGCLEFAFDDAVLVFRDSCDLDWGPLEQLVDGTTARVLNLGGRYAVAIAQVLEGVPVVDAVAQAEG